MLSCLNVYKKTGPFAGTLPNSASFENYIASVNLVGRDLLNAEVEISILIHFKYY
jgi:hypothetical protein